jgi:RNA recognition motif-containing protein
MVGDSLRRRSESNAIIIMNTRLYVGNLSYNTTENDLEDLFSQHGTVSEVSLMLDRATGRPRGFAFVTMADVAGAEAATQALNGTECDGRALTVNVARPREERPSHGGGGRGRGRDRW